MNKSKHKLRQLRTEKHRRSHTLAFTGTSKLSDTRYRETQQTHIDGSMPLWLKHRTLVECVKKNCVHNNIDWLTDWFIDWVIDWLIEYFIRLTVANKQTMQRAIMKNRTNFSDH